MGRLAQGEGEREGHGKLLASMMVIQPKSRAIEGAKSAGALLMVSAVGRNGANARPANRRKPPAPSPF